MAKAQPLLLTRTTSHRPKKALPHHKHHSMSPFCLSIFVLTTCVALFTLFQIISLHITRQYYTSPPQWSLVHHWQKFTTCNQELKPLSEKLKESVTFLPLKDLRYQEKALEGHTWFMSSMYDIQEQGEVQFQEFPSQSSNFRVLCLKGNDTHDGSWNSYALAWLETLPYNATLMKGLTFISYNHYNYDNIWHGLSAIVPFVSWLKKNGCELPNRWVLYHWGELRFNMGPWLKTLVEATFGGDPLIERFQWANSNDPICFEKAVVMRHNEGGMSRERRIETYDLMRCKARVYCNVSLKNYNRVDNKGLPLIGMTLFMRTGPRSFKNESAVIEIFDKECAKVEGCKLMVAYSNNLTFCEQVKLMSLTDILVSPHGAQLTNMFLMDKNSSVMEFFPKGWLKLAGVGQFVFQWIASWSGMKHQGAWRDPTGDHCPFPEDDRRCMSIYKGGKIGFNETYFSEWARNVLHEVKTRKLEDVSSKSNNIANNCACN